MSKTITASLLPLFDRLVGAAPGAAGESVLLDGSGLQQSLQRDLQRLFNIRNSMTIQAFLDGQPGVLEYGLPDVLALSPQSDQDLIVLGRVIERSLALYESRLSQVRVTVSAERQRPSAVQVRIIAAVRLGQQLCRVDFDVALDAHRIVVSA